MDEESVVWSTMTLFITLNELMNKNEHIDTHHMCVFGGFGNSVPPLWEVPEHSRQRESKELYDAALLINLLLIICQNIK